MYFGKVYKQIKRPKRNILSEFEKIGVATIHEVMNKDTLMDPGLRPITQGKIIAGPAITALNTPGDNLSLHVGLSLAEEGDILVTTFLGTNSFNAIWGELATCTAIGKNMKGVIADGAVRDINAVRKRNFPVWGRTVFPRKSAKSDLGGVNVPVVCGGTTVRPGDIIVADDDGIIVVPIEEAEQVLKKAQQRSEREEKACTMLLDGKSTFEYFGMESILEQKEIKIIDGLYNDNNNSKKI
jgi:4-hydroxy-4-methyl-2-oxoglutarate aldolase